MKYTTMGLWHSSPVTGGLESFDPSDGNRRVVRDEGATRDFVVLVFVVLRLITLVSLSV